MEDTYTVLDLIEYDTKTENIKLNCLAGKNGLGHLITSKEINRPGLTMAGFFESFAHDKIQIFGRGESQYLNKIYNENNIENIEKMMEYDVPCCIFSNNATPPDLFLELADNKQITVFSTPLSSGELINRLSELLSEIFAQKTTIPGVFVEVFGIGVIVIGESGIGKSEMALELIERGHRLIADDIIQVKKISSETLVGEGARQIKYHMEIRGLGIIDVNRLFGVGAIREKKRVQLIIELEEWNDDKEYDRLGLNEKYKEILNIKIPYLLIPVKPGRNIPIIIETASMNHRLQILGYHSAREFNNKLLNWLEIETEVRKSIFYQSEFFYRSD